MKKLFLLFSAGLISASSFAQQTTKVIDASKYQVKEATNTKVDISQLKFPAATANKTTANSGPRWYSTADVYSLLNPSLSAFVIPIWFDSTVRQTYTSGLGTVNYSSVAQVISPISGSLFNDVGGFPGQLAITSVNAYNVDSVGVEAVYNRKPAYANVVDTLIISLATSTTNYYWRASNSTSTWAGAYLPAGKDTLWGAAPVNVDSVTRTANSDVSPTRLMWKVPLTASMGDTSFNSKFFAFKPPTTPFTIPANVRTTVTFTFKSGATWVKNVDSMEKFNRFMPLVIGSTSKMEYHWYDLADRSGSSLMFSTNPTWYIPTVVIEAINTVDFRNEFLSSSVKLSCATCFNVNVAEVKNKVATVGNAYPNPASTEVTIPVSVNENAAVSVVLMNTLGQTIATQNLGNVVKGSTATASFSTKNLAAGVYLYTVDANGERATSRITVTH